MKLVIYTITCLINNKIYVGITNNFQARWNKHIYDSRHNSNCVIHRAIRKYGISNFVTNIIDSTETKNQLLELEKHYILLLKSHTSFGGYNETFGGEAPMLGRKHSKKSKLLVSQKLKGRVSPNKGKFFSQEIKNKMKGSHGHNVLQLNNQGTIIKIYDTLTAASEATGIAVSNISGVCRGKKKTAGGFVWKYGELNA